MSSIIVDIETAGIDFESLDERSREYLLKYALTDAEKREAKERLGLSPLTGEIVAIGILNPKTKKGAVYYQGVKADKERFEEEEIHFESGSEEEMLEIFWKNISKYKQVVTFNGRSFDAPYIHLRSAINKVKPSRNLMPYRYDYRTHCDLLEQLTFYGATRRFTLDFYLKRFGIKSSKENGVEGSQITQMFREGKTKEIARYCAKDVKATAELFKYWEDYLKF
ncbi:MAG: ribonuclease H-like domain-containing protein [Candidatus Moranbacteria bacterium]|nr:ribonuclease H-like domain-containing protein [Candidatus Moranbacteria bacterium]MDD5652462.1 ribonuclease H-like domain-containing protein [Candidatus Moranbacteria bacterium]